MYVIAMCCFLLEMFFVGVAVVVAVVKITNSEQKLPFLVMATFQVILYGIK